MYRLLLILICLVGCQSNENKLNLNFQVKGLKKGVVLLEPCLKLINGSSIR